MKLLTKAIRAKLIANYRATMQAGFTTGEGSPDHKPAVKFFGGSAATWLFTELSDDGDTLFGLCDMGMGFPELGYASLSELSEVKCPPFGLGIERDLHWTASKTLSEHADEARDLRRIVA